MLISEARLLFEDVGDIQLRSPIEGWNAAAFSGLVPDWDNASTFPYSDAAGNLISVPVLNSDLAGGYYRIVFYKISGVFHFMVVAVVGDLDYVNQHFGQCSMTDFCGDIYLFDESGAFTKGIRIKNGSGVALLLKKTERIDLPGVEIVDTYPGGPPIKDVVGFSSWWSGGPGSWFGGSYTPPGWDAGAVGGSNGSNNPISPLDGTTNPVVTSSNNLCSTSFKFLSVPPCQIPGGPVLPSGINSISTPVTVLFTKTVEGVDGPEQKQKPVILGHLLVNLPNYTSPTISSENLAASAFATAVATLQSNVNNSPGIGINVSSGDILVAFGNAVQQLAGANGYISGGNQQPSVQLLSPGTAFGFQGDCGVTITKSKVTPFCQ